MYVYLDISFIFKDFLLYDTILILVIDISSFISKAKKVFFGSTGIETRLRRLNRKYNICK